MKIHFIPMLAILGAITTSASHAATARGRNAQTVKASARVGAPMQSAQPTWQTAPDTALPAWQSQPTASAPTLAATDAQPQIATEPTAARASAPIAATSDPTPTPVTTTPNPTPETPTTPADTRAKERAACMGNNIGIGNTFVWASRTSNTQNYSSMVEDTQNPENNVCFVRVSLNSTDSRIDLSDIAPRYFEMGRVITCGDWADEGTLKKRILAAKKKARTWGVVASSVGGAGLGVGAMEWFGNRLIGGKVQGQKALDARELFISQLKVLKKDSPGEYQKLKDAIIAIETECNRAELWPDGRPDTCDASNNMYIGMSRELP